MAKKESTICFVIAPIGDPDSDDRKRSDQILKHVIQPAATICGYEAVRADQISEPGIITTQIIQHIIDDPVVVADLTGKNPNVFYELAIRHALRKPYVQLIQRGERIPFDVAATRTIEVDHHDLDSVEMAKAEITRQIKAMEGRGMDIESPISVAVDLEVLRQSSNPEQRQLADMLAVVGDLRSILSSVEKKLSDPTSMLPSSYFRDMVVRELRPMLLEIGGTARPQRIQPEVFKEIIGVFDRIGGLLEQVEGNETSRGKIEQARGLFRHLDRLLHQLMIDSGMSQQMADDVLERHLRRKST